MTRHNLISISIAAIGLLAAAVPAAPAQVEIDRIVSRVGGRLVMLSDVRQVRALKLVDDTTTDEAAQRAFESRLLILHELNRASPVAPAGRDEVAARRGEWAATVGGDAAVPALLARAGMSESDLDAWLGDDVRIRTYLRRQFGMLDAAERTQAMREWLARLRQRAELPQ